MRDVSLFRHAPSLVQRGDLPTGAMPPGTAPVVALAATPSHPSNAVLVHVRRDGGPAQLVRGVLEASPLSGGAQWFRAILPTLDEGRGVDYRVELIRAGQRLAALPADGSWLSVIGDEQVAIFPGETSVTQCPGIPLWTYDLSFLGTLTANLRSEVIGDTSEGYRINFFVESGHVAGPRLDAIVRRGGGDWIHVRHDGIAKPDVRITLEAADGGLILYRGDGVCDLGPDGYAKIAAGEFTGSHPYYAAVSWLTAHQNWRWLNRCQGFGIGRVVLEELQVQLDMYIPEVGGRRGDA